ncbi:RNA polymerase sigma factor SigV [compost metagenome]
MTAQEYNIAVEEWADRLYRFALKTVQEPEEAKDIVQQSYETLWINREDVPPEKVKSYLFTIAHRRCMDHFRKPKNRELHQEQITATVNPNQHSEWKGYLQEALKILDKQSKTLILLKDYEGYSYEEIGRITELSHAQVKVYLHRARKTLKEYLISKKQIL